MQFSGKKAYSGYTLHFSIEARKDARKSNTAVDFLIQAVSSTQELELLPSRLFEGYFPSAFVKSYVHWYNLRTQSVEFRPILDPWTTSDDLWKLTKSPRTGSDSWKLERSGAFLVSMNSTTAKLIAKDPVSSRRPTSDSQYIPPYFRDKGP
jgi:hypothetical protein